MERLFARRAVPPGAFDPALAPDVGGGEPGPAAVRSGHRPGRHPVVAALRRRTRPATRPVGQTGGVQLGTAAGHPVGGRDELRDRRPLRALGVRLAVGCRRGRLQRRSRPRLVLPRRQHGRPGAHARRGDRGVDRVAGMAGGTGRPLRPVPAPRLRQRDAGDWERAALHLVTVVVDRTCADGSWEGHCRQVLGWFLALAGIPSARHEPLLDRSIDDRFDTFVTPSNLLIQDVAEQLGRAVTGQ